MAQKAFNFYRTNHFSRYNLLSWVQKTLKANYSRIEELCTGAAYCQFMHMLFPKSVPLSRVRFGASTENDYIHNFKILQQAFKNLSVEKDVPIDKLIRGKFHENYEFLKWFRKFFEANYDGGFYDALGERKGQVLGFDPSPPVRKSRIAVRSGKPQLGFGDPSATYD